MGFRSDLWGNAPGFSGTAESYENEFTWGKFDQIQIAGWQIDGTARDSGSSPTTVLRKGLLLGQINSNGNLRDYSDTNTDGSDQVFGILNTGLRMADLDGNNTNKFYGIVVGGPVRAAGIFGLTEKARSQMAGRYQFDDRGYQPNLMGWRRTVAKAASYTVVNGTDNNTTFTTTGATGAIVFTLPTTIQQGQRWRFMNTVNQTLTVTAPAGKLISTNNAAATSAAFSTAGQLIGGVMEVTVDDTGTKYIVMEQSANALTVT